MNRVKLNALILIGGKSQRMGKDKHHMEIHGVPQYQHLLTMMNALEIPVFLSGTKEQFKDLPEDVPFIADKLNGIGPIGGLAAAIDYNGLVPWLIIACDLIHIKKENVLNLVKQSKGEGITTFRKSDSAFLETTITIYHPDVFPEIKKAIAAEKYSLQNILKNSEVDIITPAEDKALFNANTPEDLPE